MSKPRKYSNKKIIDRETPTAGSSIIYPCGHCSATTITIHDIIPSTNMWPMDCLNMFFSTIKDNL